MQGRTLILSMMIILTGCSVTRRGRESIDSTGYGSLNLIDRIFEKNLTENNFNITKAEIEIINNGRKQRLLASMKYRKEGIYLVSMRNRTGIEAARVYITKDTVLVNDRIYRKLYCGSTEYLSGKYGISANALPILTGDFLYNEPTHSKSVECEDGKGEIEGFIKEKKIKYSLDCNKAKVSAASIIDEKGTGGIRLEFGSFKAKGKFIYPGTIWMEDFSEQTRIRIDISAIEFNVFDNIEFIPGRNYEKIILK